MESEYIEKEETEREEIEREETKREEMDRWETEREDEKALHHLEFYPMTSCFQGVCFTTVVPLLPLTRNH